MAKKKFRYKHLRKLETQINFINLKNLSEHRGTKPTKQRASTEGVDTLTANSQMAQTSL